MITTGNTIVSIYTEMTPNPETMKFVANKLLYPGKSIDIAEESLAFASPLAKELFKFPYIKEIFIDENYISVTKYEINNWDEITLELRTFIKQYIEKWLPSFNQDNRSYLTIAIGCTGGQHRSVYFVEQLSAYFKAQNVIVRHRELD